MPGLVSGFPFQGAGSVVLWKVSYQAGLVFLFPGVDRLFARHRRLGPQVPVGLVSGSYVGGKIL